MNRIFVTILCVFVMAPAGRSLAQTKPESLSGVERLEGDWVRIDANGSGEGAISPRAALR